VEYDGADFEGWQIQPGKRTVQGMLEEAFLTVTRQAVRVHSSGRTDTGVHAREQVAHVDVAGEIEAAHLRRSLNAVLPETVRIFLVRRVRADFHARFDATAKEYRYFIWNAPEFSPLHRGYAAHVYRPLDVAAMREAASHLEGKHDFAAFSANPNRKQDETERTLFRLRVTRKGPLLVVCAVGDGFLYKMVRSLAGHLIRVGQGAVSAEETTRILESKIRTARVETAPPHGLVLWKVYYGSIPRFTSGGKSG
jgi:tRNA pseudouridine38-40 synthase